MGGLNVPDDFNPRCVGRNAPAWEGGDPDATPPRTGDFYRLEFA